jgi:hydrogenase maturation protease
LNVRILIAGIGNIFLGDDGFGVEVARILAASFKREGVCVADYGIRGLHLAYQLLEPYDLVIIADAVSRGARPGTVYLIEPEPGGAPASNDAHALVLDQVFAMARMMGGKLPRILLVGCEVADTSPGIGLSAPVRNALAEAARVIVEAVDEAMMKLATGETGIAVAKGETSAGLEKNRATDNTRRCKAKRRQRSRAAC